MKKWFILGVSSLLIGAASYGMAQSQSPSPETGTPAVSDAGHSRAAEIKKRVQKQEERVESSALTAEQAKAARDVIAAVKTQLKSDEESNAGHDLTEEQAASLNKMLDANSSLIHEDKKDDSATATPGAGH